MPKDASTSSSSNRQCTDSSTMAACARNSQDSSPPQSTEKSAEMPPPAGPPDHEYPPQRTVLLLMFGLFMAGFLVALDRTIIATAIPRITDQFDSLGDIGWYASGFLITMSGFQLFIGRIYTFYDHKTVWLLCIAIFELGSIVCGAAPTSKAFIIGRAIAGLGSAGIFSGAIVMIVSAVPLHKRPMYTGLMGATFGVASVVGPLLGGVFTNDVSWRWCFYINLPLGAVAIAVIAFLVKIPSPKRKPTNFREKISQLDPLGTVCFLPGVVCLLLALQWGGTTYTWSDGRIIALLVLFVLLLIAFIAIQIWKQETATVPPRIFKQRSVQAGMWWTFCNGSSMMVVVYYLPVWFQAIKAVSPVKSGIMTIPIVLSLVFGSIGAGFLTRKVGYYTPWMFLSAVLTPIGAGMLTTFKTNTGHAAWIGFQVLYGFGLGIGAQQANVGVQTALEKKDVPTGASLCFLCQSLGGAIFASVANNMFDNELVQSLERIPGLNLSSVVNTGATDLRRLVKPSLLPRVLTAYNGAVVDAFYVAVAMSSMAIIGAVFMPMLSIKKGSGAPGAGGPVEQKKSEEIGNKTADEKV